MKIDTLYVPQNNKEYDIIIGRNKYENDEIIKNSYENDIWFHLSDYSSCHIILKSGNDKIPTKYLKKIANMFPLYKNGLPKEYTVIYTKIKNVKFTDIVGSVIPSDIKYIKIKK
jgi:predicted ribosome quality control (RQC) complex YloA/Tae2 family protein